MTARNRAERGTGSIKQRANGRCAWSIEFKDKVTQEPVRLDRERKTHSKLAAKPSSTMTPQRRSRQPHYPAPSPTGTATGSGSSLPAPMARPTHT